MKFGLSGSWGAKSDTKPQWVRNIDAQGITLTQSATGAGADVLPDLASGFITQLDDVGLLLESGDQRLLTWDNLYSALDSEAYAELHGGLMLPPFTQSRVSLHSAGSLTDRDFSISVAGWLNTDGRLETPRITGALLNLASGVALMTATQWRVVSSIVAFAQRAPEDKNDKAHRLTWAKIRKEAVRADAVLDNFLQRSVVLAPDKLLINWRRSEEIESVVEVEPTFEDAPPDWLLAFDRHKDVPERYDITTPTGIVQVVVSARVRTVLEEIKAMPGRRVAGRRAEAFLSNPFAALGEDAQEVIDEAQFEEAKEAAGILYERFSPLLARNQTNRALEVGLLIECANQSGPFDSSEHWLSDTELANFTQLAESSVASEHQFVAWNGFDLEVQGDTQEHIRILKDALRERTTSQILITYDEVYDLTNYSSRVEGIGSEKPYYSPYIAKKKDDEGWFPENVQPLIALTTADGVLEAIPADELQLNQIRDGATAASARGETEFTLGSLPEPMSVQNAAEILSAHERVAEDVRAGTYDPAKGPSKPKQGQRLLIKQNIVAVDYEEARTEALTANVEPLQLPSALAPNVKLLPHQEAGISWMEHLFRLRDQYTARGAVLADDMGLGKTLQLLVFMANVLERFPDCPPMLVVAPVALLENWEDEIKKFFKPNALPVLTAYGDKLAALRIPRAQIAERLRTEAGLDKFLKPNWVGGARVVLTTYETLRDYEFGFAKQRWSVMVCDEAQRIKNPAAMVTRAAKKQQVQFKIACTGTPVENALVDLWCLFDFIQPGLLGALNDFGQKYSKPIEAKTDDERARVEELRARISPQILRRTKAEVAKDLPAKRVVQSCRSLAISNYQRSLYAKALEDFKNRKSPGATSPFKNHLGLLHYLRSLCTDPQRYGQHVFKPEAIDAYRTRAPKLDWLLKQLVAIKEKQEKVIIFCEFREIQRLLQHYIREAAGISCDIINGDTSASSASELSRQKRIKAFQAAPGFGAIILSPLAVGFGVNIQAANHVIHYTRTWNPAKEDQATDRAYRIGQTKEVFVYYPTITAPDFTTFEAKLDTLLTRKRELAADMLNGSGDVSFEDFVLDDLATSAATTGLDERISLDAAQRMSGRYFEALVAALWTKMGYKCHLTPQTGDKGIDVVALKGAHGVLLQAKTAGAANSRLNWEAVKDVVTGAAFYQQQHSGVTFERVCITNRLFNTGAHEQAALNGVVLYDENSLGSSLDEHPIYESDVERIVHAD